MGAVRRERAARGPRQRAQVGARSRAAAPRSRASARTYVPAEHTTSTTAIGRSGSRSSHSSEVERADLHAARRQVGRLARASHLVRPPAADLDGRVRRRPLELLAEEARQRGHDAPPASGAGAVDRRQLAVEVVRRGRRAEAHRRAIRLVVARGGTRPAASPQPRNSGSTPEANGSSVPPCPIRRVCARRRTSATTSCDVGPAGLATTRTPSIPGASGWRGTASGGRRARDGVGEPLCLGEDPAARLGQRGLDRRARRAGVPTTTERAGQDGRIDAAGLRPDGQPRGRRSGLLEQDRDLGRLRLRQEVDEALGVRRRACPSPSGRRRTGSCG